MIKEDKFKVFIPYGTDAIWPKYFRNFYWGCYHRANRTRLNHLGRMNQELKPFGGELISTPTRGMYLQWDDENSHTMFVLKWS